MEKLEKEIINTCKKRYGGNLAGILIFGSYNSGPFVYGVSDVDSIILLRQQEGLELAQEKEKILSELADARLAIHHLRSVEDYERNIYSEGSWSSWITVINGSKVLYTTPELESFRDRLRKKPIDKKKLRGYLVHKDEFELEGYFKKRAGWDLVKALFAHMRRKIQILNYYSGNELSFDYLQCLKGIPITDFTEEEWEDLLELNDLYQKRGIFAAEDAVGYIEIARRLTSRILPKIS